MSDLPIIQKTYDLIKWYVPILNRLPRDHKFLLGNRMITGLYDLLDVLLTARYAKQKLTYLEPLNSKLDILRHQTRLLLDYNLIKTERYEYAQRLLNDVGIDLGGWIKQQKNRDTDEKNGLRLRSALDFAQPSTSLSPRLRSALDS